MSFDEFELRIYAVGNIKGTLYKDYQEILELNTKDASNELKKYIKDDKELNELIEYMSFDEDILKEKNGNVFFVSETNWLEAKLVNLNMAEVSYESITLDTDNIIDALRNKELLFDCIF